MRESCTPMCLPCGKAHASNWLQALRLHVRTYFEIWRQSLMCHELPFGKRLKKRNHPVTGESDLWTSFKLIERSYVRWRTVHEHFRGAHSVGMPKWAAPHADDANLLPSPSKWLSRQFLRHCFCSRSRAQQVSWICLPPGGRTLISKTFKSFTILLKSTFRAACELRRRKVETCWNLAGRSNTLVGL